MIWDLTGDTIDYTLNNTIATLLGLPTSVASEAAAADPSVAESNASPEAVAARDKLNTGAKNGPGNRHSTP